MNKLLTTLICLVAVTVFGATPSFQSLNMNQFGTNGNLITIKTGALTTNAVIYKMANITNDGNSVVLTNGNVTASGTSAAARFQASGVGATSITMAPTATDASAVKANIGIGGVELYSSTSVLQFTVNPSGAHAPNGLEIGGGILSGNGSGLTNVVAASITSSGSASNNLGLTSAFLNWPIDGASFYMDPDDGFPLFKFTDEFGTIQMHDGLSYRVGGGDIAWYLDVDGGIVGTSLKIKSNFQAGTNLAEISAAGKITGTGLSIATNIPASWPTLSASTNQCFFGPSNNAVYLLTTVFNSRVWGATNRIGP